MRAGSPVLHQNSTYAIFWDPTYRTHPWTGVIDQFFQNIVSTARGSLASVFEVDTQYTDKTNNRALLSLCFPWLLRGQGPVSRAGRKVQDPNLLRGGDADPRPQRTNRVAQQTRIVIIARKIPKGMGTIYYLLLPWS